MITSIKSNALHSFTDLDAMLSNSYAHTTLVAYSFFFIYWITDYRLVTRFNFSDFASGFESERSLLICRKEIGKISQ